MLQNGIVCVADDAHAGGGTLSAVNTAPAMIANSTTMRNQMNQLRVWCDDAQIRTHHTFLRSTCFFSTLPSTPHVIAIHFFNNIILDTLLKKE